MTDAAHDEARPRTGSQAVERALAILDCFRGPADELSITEIARMTNLHVTTAYRITRALCHQLYLEQDDRNERYRLGPSIAVLGQRAFRSAHFYAAQPIVDRLAEETGESASLGLRDRDQVMVVLRTVSSQPLHFDHPPGTRLNLHASAMGKAILAFSGSSPNDAVHDLADLPQYTRATITAHEELVAELARIRERGFAVNSEERYAGVNGIAAPVRDAFGQAFAAVGIQGPSVRLVPLGVEAIAPKVVAAAAELATVLRVRSTR